MQARQKLLDALSMLELLALSEKDIQAGKVSKQEEVLCDCTGVWNQKLDDFFGVINRRRNLRDILLERLLRS